MRPGLGGLAIGLVLLATCLSACNTGPFDQEPWDPIRDYSGKLPVFPGAEGFGAYTIAGRGGEVVRVTNLNASGAGSLRAAIDHAVPRTIVFDVGGVIDLEQALVIRHPYVTIAGQTAPSPSITIMGAGIVVHTHDVLLQHVRVRVGDRPNGPRPDGRDGIGVAGTPDAQTLVYNVMIDHCSVSWAIDEGCSTWHPGVSDVTFRQCIIAENLARSIHPKGEHSKGLLIGDHTRRIAAIGNLFAHNTRRNPLIKGDVSALVVNNLIYNPDEAAIHFSDPEGRGPSQASIEGNVLVPGPDTGRSVDIIQLSWDTKKGTKVHAKGNVETQRARRPLALSAAKTPNTESAPVAWVTPLTLRSSEEVPDWVMAHAGAIPTDRDETDARVVRNVAEGNGCIIDSQEEVGGFPSPTPVTRVAEVPERPNADDDGDGYTNIEEWLHELAAAAEGR